MKRYYKLDIDGKVQGSYALNQPGIEGIKLLEEPEIDNAKWDGFQWVEDAALVSKEYERQLAESDASITRGIDDLIRILIIKGTIAIEDLPEEIQTKYNDRAILRSKIL